MATKSPDRNESDYKIRTATPQDALGLASIGASAFPYNLAWQIAPDRQAQWIRATILSPPAIVLVAAERDTQITLGFIIGSRIGKSHTEPLPPRPSPRISDVIRFAASPIRFRGFLARRLRTPSSVRQAGHPERSPNRSLRQRVHVGQVAVSPAAQGYGVGTALVRDAIRLARAEGYDAVSLHVEKNNLAALCLYYKLGFVQTHESRRSYELRHYL